MGNCNREIRVNGNQTFTDVREKYCYTIASLIPRNLCLLRSENPNYFQTLLAAKKGIT